MRTMVGKIASVEGVAEVIDARGQHHTLVAGDWLREGDRLVTGQATAVTVETTQGGMVEVREAQTITLNAQLGSDFFADSSDDAVNPLLLQHVLAAIRAGDDAQDLSLLLGSLQAEEGFAAFALHAPVAPVAEVALQIEDLLPEASSAPSALSVGAHQQAINLMVDSGLPSEVALQQYLLKDYLKDS